jgi:peptide/nickel transport system ATP-binding protein
MSSDRERATDEGVEPTAGAGGAEADAGGDRASDAGSDPATGDDERPLLRVRNLTKHFDTGNSLLDRLVGDTTAPVRAVDGISFDVHEGETLGLVGESGCGKSTTGETILQLQAPTAGTVEYDGEDLVGSDDRFWFRRRAGVVFQDPFSSLDPRMTVGASVRQPLDVHGWPWPDVGVETTAEVTTDGLAVDVSVDDDVHRVDGVEPVDGVASVHLTVRRRPPEDPPETLPAETVVGPQEDAGHVQVDGEPIEVRVAEALELEVSGGDGLSVAIRVGRSDAELRRERARRLMERVGLSADQFDRYPNEFSGGQRQRIGIARALALDPEFLVLDEPTSALDVSVQAQVLNLLEDLQDDFDLTYLFISHDLSVIRHICDRVAVMYLGEIVEIAPTDELFADPQHPYTEALLESVPRASTDERERDVDPLAGDVPSPRDPPSGCRFRTRCPKVIPPADVDLSQRAYRAVMDVRERIERRDVGLAELRERATAGDADADADATPDDPDGALVEALFDRLVADDVDLPAEERAYLREAFQRLAGGEWDAAAEVLRERYESVCETHSPEEPRAACHLRGLPEDVDPADVDRVEER